MSGSRTPFFRPKRYLSGLDWVAGLLDYTLKKTTCAGNISQVILTLAHGIDETSLERKLCNFISSFPIACGKMSRDYLNLAPYWKFSGEMPAKSFSFIFHSEDEIKKEGGAFAVMTNCANIPFGGEHEHLAFHLIRSGEGKDYFVMTFDHKLFDAQGAESFLEMFWQYCVDGDAAGKASGVRLTASSGLANWMEKFYAGQAVNRKFLALSENPSRTLPVVDLEVNTKIKFRHIHFDKNETKKIFETAHDQAGYLMEMPYLFATVIQVMHIMFDGRFGAGTSYLVPVSMDKRESEDIKEELFFNYASFLMFQFSVQAAGDREALITAIKSQMYEQVRDSLPQAIADASMLLRIAPFPLLEKLFTSMQRTPFSFFFSYLGKSKYEKVELMEAEVENIFHMPRMPIPPGIGIFFSEFGGRLNAIVSWFDGIVPDGEIDMIESELRCRL